jgi:hypothetical protein
MTTVLTIKEVMQYRTFTARVLHVDVRSPTRRLVITHKKQANGCWRAETTANVTQY